LFAVFAVASVSPAFALTLDPNRIIPTRGGEEQKIYYYRLTVNYNDPRIASGVWFGTIGKNSYIFAIDAYVTTAFNAGTTNTITIGATAANANEVLASGITAGSTGVYHLTSAAGLGTVVTSNTTYQTAINGAVPLYVKYAQTGTAATTGQVTIVIAYVPNNDQ
jgi:hypothetical protein